jgi:hypothetical protein
MPGLRTLGPRRGLLQVRLSLFHPPATDSASGSMLTIRFPGDAIILTWQHS